MQVNICHRLIKNMIEHEQNFINHYGCIISENIHKGVYATRTYAIDDIVLKLEGDLVLHLWTFPKALRFENADFEKFRKLLFYKLLLIY